MRVRERAALNLYIEDELVHPNRGRALVLCGGSEA